MFTTPEPIKSDAKQYSALVRNKDSMLYEWTETQKFYTTQEKLDRHKKEEEMIKVGEQTRDSAGIIAQAQEELDWIAAAEATK